MRVGIYALYFFSFFPFVTLYNWGTDTQPYALMVSILILLGNRLRMDKKMIMLANVSVFAVFLMLIYGDFGFNSLRSLFNYLSVFFVSWATYTALNKTKGLNEKIIKIFINIWLLVASVQRFIKPDFMFSIVAGARTSSTRGVPSLTSEPSFYGYMIIFSFLFVLDFKEDRWVYMINLLIQLLFFAQSSVGVVYFLIYIGIIGVSYVFGINVRRLILVMGGIGLLSTVMWRTDVFQGTRIFAVLSRLLSDPRGLYYLDQSVRSRVNHIVNPINASLKTGFFPKGFAAAYQEFGYSRIMSGYGAAIYELGIVGIVLIMHIFRIIYSANGHVNRKYNALFVSIIMFSAIQLASPILGFYLGYCLFKNKEHCLAMASE